MSRQEEARQTIQAFKDAAEAHRLAGLAAQASRNAWEQITLWIEQAEKRIDELEQVCRQAVTAFEGEVSDGDPTIAALKAAVAWCGGK